MTLIDQSKPQPYSHREPCLSGELRQQPEDFFVEEILGFEPEGEGEHVFLWIEKSGLNSQQVADKLARFAQVPAKLVSYAGMKDRQAITRQWFSVHLPGHKNLAWSELDSPSLTVLKQSRHLRKLRRGAHRGNRFVIAINALEGDIAQLDQTVQVIATEGVANYFGEQRFGRQGQNLSRAQQYFAGEIKPKRHLRGIYLSAARAWIFNQSLALRVAQGSWNRLLDGELIMLDGSHSVFPNDHEASLAQRLADGDIHPSGPMVGNASGLAVDDAVAAIEQSVFDQYPELLAGLQKAGLKAQRRSLRLIPSDLQCQQQKQRAEFSFSLPTGCFATAVIRELVNYQQVGR